MIPIRDTNPSGTFPLINYTLIILNVIAFLIERSLGGSIDEFIFQFGVVPARVSVGVENMDFSMMLIFPFLTSMFLHGGWVHLIGNMIFLYIFGDNVEDKFGHGKYLIFYLLAGSAAALTQVWINPTSDVPMVGASGAIAGVLGAYVLMFPRAKILTLIPIFFFFQFVELPAYLFLGIWFMLQMFSGLMALNIAADAGGVAWWAHIGGFIIGVIAVPLMKKSQWK